MPRVLKTCSCANVSWVLTCSRANVFCVLTCSRGNVPCMLTCSRANIPCVLTCSRALRANVPTCQRALRAYVLTCQHALRAYVLKCQSALCANGQLALCAHLQKVSTGLFFIISSFFFCFLYHSWYKQCLGNPKSLTVLSDFVSIFCFFSVTSGHKRKN